MRECNTAWGAAAANVSEEHGRAADMSGEHSTVRPPVLSRCFFFVTELLGRERGATLHRLVE